MQGRKEVTEMFESFLSSHNVKLGSQEKRILQEYLTTSKTTEVIGKEMFLSKHTINNHLAAARDKFNVSSTREILELYINWLNKQLITKGE